MARIEQKPTIKVEATFIVTESELRALEALSLYGDDAFIKMFYDQLGKSYLGPHEKGLREFLSSVRDLARPILYRTDAARKAFVGDSK